MRSSGENPAAAHHVQMWGVEGVGGGAPQPLTRSDCAPQVTSDYRQAAITGDVHQDFYSIAGGYQKWKL